MREWLEEIITEAGGTTSVQRKETVDRVRAHLLKAVKENLEGHVPPEQELLKLAYPGSLPVCTDQFLNVSKDQYPLPWLIREIVQNFIDANPGEKEGTLDGVHFTEESSSEGSHRFTVEGDWPFEKYTGLTALHSGKAKDADARTRKQAGGNGIGIKQTILRLLRDYGVQHFWDKGKN